VLAYLIKFVAFKKRLCEDKANEPFHQMQICLTNVNVR
jgi:hypothetical protein